MDVFGLWRMSTRGGHALTVQAAFAAFFLFVTSNVPFTFCILNRVLSKSYSHLVSYDFC